MAVDTELADAEVSDGVDNVPVSRDITTAQVVAYLAVVFGLSFILGWSLGAFDLEGPVVVLETGFKLASAAVGFALLLRLGWIERAGFRLPARWSRLWLAWLPVLYLVFAALPGYPSRSIGQIFAVAAFTIAVGLDEEVWSRGLLLESMRWRGTSEAVIYSGVLFGLFHGVNVMAGQPATTTAVQMGAATCWGLALGAVRVRVGSIWPCIAIHALWDFLLILRSGEVSETVATGWREAAATLLLFMPLAFYALVLARPSKVPGPDGRIPRPEVPGPSGWPARPARDPGMPTEPLGPWPPVPPEVEAVRAGR
jgi:membrane protease YdiL (CAAX protease family)